MAEKLLTLVYIRVNSRLLPTEWEGGQAWLNLFLVAAMLRCERRGTMRKGVLRRVFLISAVICLAVSLSSCSFIKSMGGMFKDLFQLQRKLAKEFNHNEIKVEIKNKNLVIIFQNSSFGKLDGKEKREKAQQIATFAKDNYPRIEQLEQISVNFAFEKEYGPLTVKGTQNSFSFKLEELEMPPPSITEETKTSQPIEPSWIEFEKE